MTLPPLPLLLALFFFLPFSFLSVLLLFLPPLPLLPTSVSPCGGSLKVFSCFSLSLFLCVCFLVRSLLFSFLQGYLHSLALSRRARRKHVSCMRTQQSVVSAKIFLVLLVHHTHGSHVVAAQSRLILGYQAKAFRLNVAPYVFFSPVESVIAPIVSRRRGTVKTCSFGPSDLSQMGHRYNFFWLSQFCVTLGVLWTLAPFIDAEDGSPLCTIRLVIVRLLSSQLLQLAFRRSWNASLVSVFAVSLRGLLSGCLEYSAPFDRPMNYAFLTCLFAIIAFIVAPCYTPSVNLLSSRSALVFTNFLRWLCPALWFAFCAAPFSLMAALEPFTGSIQDFSQIADDDEDMSSEYGSDEGNAADSPTHPDNSFFSQIAQPASTPAIITTARMASVPLPVSRAPSRASSAHTVRNPRPSAKPYDKKSSSKSSKPPSAAPSRSGSPVPSRLPIAHSDWTKFTELLTHWREQSLLYHASFQFKDQHPFPPEMADEAAYYYANIGCINQEVASVHLASGVLGHFITNVGRSKVEQQLKLLGGDLDTEDIDLLVDSGHKSLSQLLADEHIDLNDIAPSYIPADIPVTPAPSSLPLPALPVPLVPPRSPPRSLPLPSSVSAAIPAAVSSATPAVVTDTRAPSSSPLSYIDESSSQQQQQPRPIIAHPQPSRPISALSLGGVQVDPLCTPTFRPTTSPPVVHKSVASMEVDASPCSKDKAIPSFAPALPQDPLELQAAHAQLAALQKATEEAERELEAKRK